MLVLTFLFGAVSLKVRQPVAEELQRRQAAGDFILAKHTVVERPASGMLEFNGEHSIQLVLVVRR